MEVELCEVRLQRPRLCTPVVWELGEVSAVDRGGFCWSGVRFFLVLWLYTTFGRVKHFCKFETTKDELLEMVLCSCWMLLGFTARHFLPEKRQIPYPSPSVLLQSFFC